MRENRRNPVDPVHKIETLRLKQKADSDARRIEIELKIERVKREREEKKHYVRQRTPNISIVIDALKAAFGEDQVRVLMVQEDGFVMKAKGFRGF